MRLPLFMCGSYENRTVTIAYCKSPVNSVGRIAVAPCNNQKLAMFKIILGMKSVFFSKGFVVHCKILSQQFSE